MTATMNTKIENLFTNPEYTEELNEVNTIEDLFAFLKKNEVEITAEEMEASVNAASEVMIDEGLMDENGELSEELLDMVAGGKGAGAVITAGVIFSALGIAYKASKAAAFASVIGSGFLTLGGILLIAGVLGIGISIVQSKLKKKGLL